MEIGRYVDGRAVTYNEVTHEFGIEGIRTTLELLMRYDRAGQITWSSEQMRTWVRDYAEGAAAQAATPAPSAYGDTTALSAYGSPSAPAAYGTPIAPAMTYGAAAAPTVSPAFGAAALAYGGAGVATYDSRYGLTLPHERVTPSNTNVTGRRYGAFLIDSLILWPVLVIVSIFVGIAIGISSGGNSAVLDGLRPLYQVIIYVGLFGYFILSEAWWGTTIGKRMLGLHVLQTDGSRITMLQAFLRNIMLPIDFLFFTLPAILSINSSELHQRLGDRVANTAVISQR